MPAKKPEQDVPEQLIVALPLVWIGVDDADITFVNSIAVQPQGEEVIILLGQQAPPLLLGTPTEVAKAAKSITHVPVKVAMRIGTTRQRLAEFAEVLARAVTNAEQQAALSRQDQIASAIRQAQARALTAPATGRKAPLRRGRAKAASPRGRR